MFFEMYEMKSVVEHITLACIYSRVSVEKFR